MESDLDVEEIQMAKDLDIKEIQKRELEMLTDMVRVCRENNLTYSLAFGSVLGAVRHKGFIPWDDDVDIMVDIDSYLNFCNVLQDRMSDRYTIYSCQNNPEYEYLFARIGLRDADPRGILIDVFPMVGMPKSKLARKLYARIAHLVVRSFFIKKVRPEVNYSNKPGKRRLAWILKAAMLPFPPGLFIWFFEKLQKTFPISGSEYLYNFCGLYKYKEIVPKTFLSDLAFLDFEGYPLPVPKDWHRYLTHIYGDYMTPKKTNYV